MLRLRLLLRRTYQLRGTRYILNQISPLVRLFTVALVDMNRSGPFLSQSMPFLRTTIHLLIQAVTFSWSLLWDSFWPNLWPKTDMMVIQERAYLDEKQKEIMHPPVLCLIKGILFSRLRVFYLKIFRDNCINRMSYQEIRTQILRTKRLSRASNNWVLKKYGPRSSFTKIFRLF